MRVFHVLIAVAGILFGLAMPARADTVDDCMSSATTFVISGCTSLIEAGQIDGVPISRENLAAAYNNRAQAFMAKRDYNRAIVDHTEAIRLDPKSDIAFSGRGNAHALRGDYQLSILDHNEAVHLAPQNPAAYHNRGVVHFLFQSYADAVLDFKRAVILQPRDASMRQSLADTFYFTGDVARAVEEWSEACALADPALSQTWQNRLAELGYYDDDIDGLCDTRVVDAFEACARSGCYF